METFEGNVLGQGAYTWTRRERGHSWADPCGGSADGPRLNNNMLVVGAPGSGKSRSVVEPNVMQLSSSYVVVDPKGALWRHLAPGLKDAGYRVSTLNLADPRRSDCTWNPLSAARTVAGAESLARAMATSYGSNSRDPFWDNSSTLLLASLILATGELDGFAHDLSGVLELEARAYERAKEGVRRDGSRRTGGPATPPPPLPKSPDGSELGRIMAGLGADPAETTRITSEYDEALAAWRAADDEVQAAKEGLHSAARNDTGDGLHDPETRALALVNRACRESRLGEGTQHDLSGQLAASYADLVRAYRSRDRASGRLQRASEQQPAERRSEALELFDRVSSSAPETWESIKVTAASVIDQWRDPALLAMLSGGSDELDPTLLGREKSALFVIVSDTDDALYPLAGILVSQVVDALVELADSQPDGRLPVPVRFILDDFATMRGGSWAAVDRWANATRSRDLWWTVVVQSLAQLEDMLGAARARSLVAACDQQVYMGAPADLVTARYVSALTGEGERDVIASGTESELIVLRGTRPRRTTIFDPDLHPNRVEFEFARIAGESQGITHDSRRAI